MKLSIYLSTFLILSTSVALAEDAIVTMQHIAGSTTSEAGVIVLQDTVHGLLISPALKGFKEGIRGMHVHEAGDCSAKEGVVGGAAGGHYDPHNKGEHLGPYQEGHLGDLPPLYVHEDGTAGTPVLAPRVKIKDIRGRALMIHEGGDNFADVPKKLGGGGGRVACGVIPLK